ncbi:MAG: TlpA family protein disulfide reductase [Planctomycetes bacterium]|nr:TlpA family protein disulfide reductase [Planctomycetota bacterium]
MVTRFLSSTLWLGGILWIGAASAACLADDGAGATRLGSSQTAANEDKLWREIEQLREPRTTTQPQTASLADELVRQRALLEHARLYLTLYPGGEHHDEAVRLELAALFEIGCLSGGALEPLCARVREYLRKPPSDAARDEAAYWKIICERVRQPAASQPTSMPGAGPDEALLRAYREYVERCPGGRHAPRLTALLFEDALRRGDRAELRTLVSRLEEHFPNHASTNSLKAQLHREEAVGHPFWLTFEKADGARVDTREWLGTPCLIVVWAGFDAGACRYVREIEAFRADYPSFRVAGVNLDSTAAEMEAACRDLGVSWPQFHDGLGWANEFARRWGVRQLPRVFAIDRTGRLTGSAGGGEWRQLVQRLVNDHR